MPALRFWILWFENWPRGVAITDIKNFEKELVNYVNNNELGKQIYNIIHETHDLPKGNEIDQLLVEFKKAR